MTMNNVFIAVVPHLSGEYEQLSVANEVWTEQNELAGDSFYLTRKLNEEDYITVKLEDGTGFSISKQQSLNDVTHRYWAIHMLVPPLEYCKVEYAGRGISDSLESEAAIRHIWINGEEVTPTTK